MSGPWRVVRVVEQRSPGVYECGLECGHSIIVSGRQAPQMSGCWKCKWERRLQKRTEAKGRIDP